METTETADRKSILERITVFFICYATAAAIQFVGTFSLFSAIGGSWVHGVAGAITVELMILAANDKGAKSSGRLRGFLFVLSLFLISVSALFQVADMVSHKPDPELADRLAGLYGLIRVVIPVMPAVAMGAATIVKFYESRNVPAAPVAIQQGQHGEDLNETVRSTVGGAMAAINDRLDDMANASQAQAAAQAEQTETLRTELVAAVSWINTIEDQVSAIQTAQPQPKRIAAPRQAKPQPAAQIAAGETVADWPAGSWQQIAETAVRAELDAGRRPVWAEIERLPGVTVSRQMISKTFRYLVQGE